MSRRAGRGAITWVNGSRRFDAGNSGHGPAPAAPRGVGLSAGAAARRGPAATDPGSAAAEVFGRLAGAGLPELPALAGALTRRRLRAGQTLFRTGEHRPQVFVVVSGVVKMVYETAAGDAWIKGFAEPGVCFASLTALQPAGRTSFSACAAVATHLEQIDYAVLAALAARHHAWQRALTQAFMLYGQRKEQRERDLLTLAPEDRYLAFVERHPALAAVLRQRDIAAYVRVTPVALSRIKARLTAAGRLG